MRDTAEQIIDALMQQRAAREEGLRALWRMTPAQRTTAMYNDELTWWQLCHWAKHAPHELPTLNGEFWFIAVNTPEIADREPADRSGP